MKKSLFYYIVHNLTWFYCTEYFAGLQIPSPLIWFRPRNHTWILTIMYRVNNFNPMFYTNLDTWLGLHHSCFHVTSLVVCPCYWTFTGRAISSLSCMSRASIVYTSRTSSLSKGHIRLPSVGEYERDLLLAYEASKCTCIMYFGLAGSNASPRSSLLTVYPSMDEEHFSRNSTQLKYHDQILIDFSTSGSRTLRWTYYMANRSIG